VNEDKLVVLCTVPDAETAARLARAVVDERLAACVSVVPGLRSIYRWKGEICDDAEVLLVAKTRRAAFEALRARLVALHPYEVPEVVALPIVAGHHPYLAWLDASLDAPE
jgi:periplasmic divalent cation tolerance protein